MTDDRRSYKDEMLARIYGSNALATKDGADVGHQQEDARVKDAIEIAEALADELEKRSQPGDRWMAIAARSLVDTHLPEIRQALTEAGICPDCLQAPQHHYEEPFSTCACGTGEDYGDRPMHRLQRLEAAMPSAEQLQALDDLASLGEAYAGDAVASGPRGWHRFKMEHLRYLATAGTVKAHEAVKRLKGALK